MKTLIIAIALGFAGSFTAAHAESFNQRGEDFIASVKPDPKIQRQSVGILPSGFNERGYDHTVMIAARSNKPLNDVRLSLTGFNDRSHISFY
ncbi:MAG: hypothetical protein IPK63_17545 [Candidatus Competibacteraceae bacterium]|nr:hypothetical protein [Candidatus Competibacteraceae bacterium]